LFEGVPVGAGVAVGLADSGVGDVTGAVEVEVEGAALGA